MSVVKDPLETRLKRYDQAPLGYRVLRWIFGRNQNLLYQLQAQWLPALHPPPTPGDIELGLLES